MKIKNELKAASQLVGLLCLLFWSFTWNIPKDFDLSKPKKSLKSLHDTCLKDTSNYEAINKRALFLESSKSGKYFSTHTGSLLLPFNVWKEIELRKQEPKDAREKIPVPKVPRRKLNYASAKCGAKILASNRESKHRLSILNEKVDEYMLNPCGIKVWFIVELCDTIEASQIELANYELYSSMPKDFSIFWSSVYPAQAWHHLGTFQAENQRRMQTFNMNSRNLGKFIKVIISSHHGREHFCPLSVFRVVGYSMVYEYDIIEEHKEEKTKNESKMNGAASVMPKELVNSSKLNSSIKQITSETKSDLHPKIGTFPVKLCQMIQKYCLTSQSPNVCENQSTCRFLTMTLFRGETSCVVYTEKLSTNGNGKSRNLETNVRSESYNKGIPKNTNVSDKAKILNRMSQNLHNSTSTFRNREDTLKKISSKELNRSSEQNYSDGKYSQISVVNNKTGDLLPRNERVSETDSKFSGSIPETNEILHSGNECDCSREFREQLSLKQNSSSEASPSEHQVAESAALNQKESVLVKMNMRIKTLETNLGLINRYLQHLSESYRMQVEDMLRMFDGTIKAITVTSAKAAIVDKQQQLIIDQLDRRTNILSMKIQHLGNGQSGILKQVLELHGFFLILEIIIISTISSVFFNKLKRDILV